VTLPAFPHELLFVGKTVSLLLVVVAINVPPQLPVNHCHFDAEPSVPPFTVSVLPKPGATEAGDTERLVGAVEVVFTINAPEPEDVKPHVPLVGVALHLYCQPLFAATTELTLNVAVVQFAYVGFEPAAVILFHVLPSVHTCHWYVGELVQTTL